ncbi:MAG: TetR/AcrR family transcriptional regulator [Pyrinomonadaceae bacterium]|nr:TetR/AcrR family transcriptional regulator [Pyrinomonadaceae bacterium]
MAKNNSEIKADLRQEILDAAREMFVAEGYANVSMRKIAEKIGYSPTTIYLYFKDKNDLLHQICEESFAQLARNISSIQQLSANSMDKLRMGLREYINFGLKHPSHYEVIFIMPLKSEVEAEYEMSQGKVAFETLCSSVSDCIKDNLLKNNDVGLISQTLWAGIHGITSLLITHSGFPFAEREKLIDNVIETLISGIEA